RQRPRSFCACRSVPSATTRRSTTWSERTRCMRAKSRKPPRRPKDREVEKSKVEGQRVQSPSTFDIRHSTDRCRYHSRSSRLLRRLAKNLSHAVALPRCFRSSGRASLRGGLQDRGRPDAGAAGAGTDVSREPSRQLWDDLSLPRGGSAQIVDEEHDD